MATIHVPLSQPALPNDEGIRTFDETVADPLHNITRASAWAALTKRRPAHRLEIPWTGDVAARNPRPRDEAHASRTVTASPWAHRWAARLAYQATSTVSESADVGRPHASIVLRVRLAADDSVIDAIHWRVADRTLPTGILIHDRPSNRPYVQGVGGVSFPIFVVDTGSSSTIDVALALPNKPRLLTAPAGVAQYFEIVATAASVHWLEVFEVPYREFAQ